MTMEQYGLILATALLSIVANPLLFHAIPWVERQAAAPASDCGAALTITWRRRRCHKGCPTMWLWSAMAG